MIVTHDISCYLHIKTKQGTKRRYVDLDEHYEYQPVEIIGLSPENINGEIIGQPMRLVSKYVTTRIGLSYESASRSVFSPLPFAGDLSNPMTLVSYRLQ